MASGDWYYNSYSGEVTQMGGGIAYITAKAGIGWHGPFASHDAAIKFYNDGKAANPGWKPPVSDLNIIGQIQNAASSAGEKASAGIGAVINAPGNAIAQQYNSTIEKILGPIQAGVKIWAARIAEVLLGLILIGIGVAEMTGKSNAISRTFKTGVTAAITKGAVK